MLYTDTRSLDYTHNGFQLQQFAIKKQFKKIGTFRMTGQQDYDLFVDSWVLFQ